MSQKRTLINESVESHSKKKLQEYYKDHMIPAEKKSYLTDLRKSEGGLIAVESHDKSPHYFLDAASQIATLGLGLNPNEFFGIGHHLEAWTNSHHNNSLWKTRWKDLFSKHLRTLCDIMWCHSGAEANEIALGMAYEKRIHSKAKTVLAFEGSFHGRMMVAVASTWNPSKREAFTFPGYETSFAPYPEVKSSHTTRSVSKEWRNYWDGSSSSKESIETLDSEIKLEMDCLHQVEKQLASQKIFSILIEPMQCEGGDRYSTNRFHTALALLAKRYGVALIYDEVQTGLHLGRKMFWHSDFNLTDSKGDTLHPDYMVCAKKAQVGAVVCFDSKLESYSTIRHDREEVNIASVIRGLTHALALEQSHQKILDIEKTADEKLQKLVEKYPKYLSSPRACGMAFAVDLPDSSWPAKLVASRFKYGLLFYPAGDQTLRFRLNTGMSAHEIEFLFSSLDLICQEVFLGETPKLPTTIPTKQRGVEDDYLYHQKAITNKSQALKQGKRPGPMEVFQSLSLELKEKFGLELKRISEKDFTQNQDKISKLQAEVYEPARQTSIENFQKAAESKDGHLLAAFKDDKMVGLSVAAPLSNYPFERGTRLDPLSSSPKALYVLDVTVSSAYRGQGLGKFLKQALSSLSFSSGASSISGRNRDQLASSMMSINLSLGAAPLFFSPEDYPDDEQYRGVYYYHQPLAWENVPLALSSAIDSPMAALPTKEVIEENLPSLINKVCLSNFVSDRFLGHLKDLLEVMPSALRHGFSASGQSECVDKIVKSIWYTHHLSKQDRPQKIVAFQGQYFGQGSFLSRSLGAGPKFFNVETLPSPTRESSEFDAQDFESRIQNALAVFIEPLEQATLKRVPLKTLESMREICKKHNIPLVFNETASSFYRFSEKNFFASDVESITPDAAFCYGGGQIGLCWLKKELFVEKPLMMISTWDGDEFSMAQFHHAVMKIVKDPQAFLETRNSFHKSFIKKIPHASNHLIDGVGAVPYPLPQWAIKASEVKCGHALILPSFDMMKTFLQTHGE